MLTQKWMKLSLSLRLVLKSPFQRCSLDPEWRKARKTKNLPRKWKDKAQFESHDQDSQNVVIQCARCSNRRLYQPKDSIQITNAKVANLLWRSVQSLAWRDFTKTSIMKDAKRCDIQILSALMLLLAEIQGKTVAFLRTTLPGKDIIRLYVPNVVPGQKARSLYSSVTKCTHQ